MHSSSLDIAKLTQLISLVSELLSRQVERIHHPVAERAVINLVGSWPGKSASHCWALLKEVENPTYRPRIPFMITKYCGLLVNRSVADRHISAFLLQLAWCPLLVMMTQSILSRRRW